MKNNLGFAARGTETSQIDAQKCDLSFNYFTLPVTVNSGDFVSIDLALLTQPRKENGDLPDINFMKLIAGSDLIDVGTDVGLAFDGPKPDLGYREFKSITTGLEKYPNYKGFKVYPNPSHDSLNIILPNQNEVDILRVFSMDSKCVKEEILFMKENIQIDISKLNQGAYILNLSLKKNNALLVNTNFIKR
jgi:hypothetical protein